MQISTSYLYHLQKYLYHRTVIQNGYENRISYLNASYPICFSYLFAFECAVKLLARSFHVLNFNPEVSALWSFYSERVCLCIDEVAGTLCSSRTITNVSSIYLIACVSIANLTILAFHTFCSNN